MEKSLKQSQHGKTFSIWKLGDLEGNKVTVFLFGDTHADHFKEAEGTIWAIIDGTIKPDERSNDGTVSVAVGSPEMIVKLVGAVMHARPRL